MKLYYVPYYCGGKFLTGLYNPEAVTFEQMHKHVADHSVPEASATVGDKYPYVPNTLLGFQQILRLLLKANRGRDYGQQGTVYAVTIPVQTLAAKYLKETGFKEAIMTQKYPGASKCVTWLGDYRKDIFPILKDVPDFVKVEVNARKFG